MNQNQNVEIVREILDDIIFDKYNNPIEPVIRQVQVGNQTLTHLHVYTQYLPHTCGYHSTYNIISFMQLISNKGLDIYSPFKFWQYCHEFKVLLKRYRELNNIQLIEPWRDEDINDGDFERTYLDVWLQSDYLPKSINIMGQEYQVIFETIYYQYGNMLSDQDELLQLEENINKFRQGNSILNIIIGATNHWVVLIAINDQQRLKFYFLDSRNDDYLLYDQQQVAEYVERIDKQDQVIFGSKPMKQYSKEIFYQSVFDIQDVTKLITRFISGEENIYNYITRQFLNGFLNPLYETLNVNQEQFLQLNTNDVIQNKGRVLKWCESYKNTMYHYMKHPKIITEQQNQILQKLLQVLKTIEDEQVNLFRESALNITQAIIDFSELHANRNLNQKQKHVYFQDSEIYQHYSPILEMKKVYIQDYATKIYSFVVRIKFQENLFHAQGGGQLDDQGYIVVANEQIKVVNLFNDRHHVEIYVDILHTIEIYEQLSQIFNNNGKILQVIDQDIRINNTRYQSAGHLINVAAIRFNSGLQMETTRHFIKEKDASIELLCSKPIEDSEDSIKDIIQNNIEDIIRTTNVNDTLKISYMSIKEIIAALTYFPDFVLEKDKIRIVKLCSHDRGFPCYGTHVKHISQLKGLNITKVEKNNNQLIIYYKL